jgi:hypothetical protein
MCFSIEFRLKLNESGASVEMKKDKFAKRYKKWIPGIPLAAAMGASLLPIQRSGHQFLILITLVWIQVFFILECFMAGK